MIQTLIELIKENDFTLEKARNRRYHAQFITDTYYTDDIVLQVNTPTLGESMLFSLEKAAGGIAFYVNVGKRESMSFNQNHTRGIYSLTGCSLKLDDKFT